MRAVNRWEVSDDQLSGLTPAKVRDLMVDCFVAAQKETFAHSQQRMHMPVDDASLRSTITTVVHTKFDDMGCSWDAPSREDLCHVRDELAREARSYGTPDEIIVHHKGQIDRAINRLPS